MMWNNRIIRHKNKDGTTYVGLHEVFYDWDDEGKNLSWTEDSMVGYFEDEKELYESVSIMLMDIKRFYDDILDEEELMEKYG